MKLPIDGLPDLFADTFGEPVVYIPAETGVPLGGGTITAIWIETPLVGVLPAAEADIDVAAVELHVRAADVPTPQEGDLVVRQASNEQRRVVGPIRRDGQGMIAVTLERLD